MKSTETTSRSLRRGRAVLRAASGASLILIVAVAPRAHADEPSPAAAGEERFRAAQDLMVAGHYEAALTMLLERQAAKPGLGVLLNIAYCQDKLGKSASAWSGYLNVAAVAHSRGDTEREQFALAQSAALAPQLARLEVDAPEGAPSDLDVRVDDALLPRASWGRAVPVDPGPHEVRAHLRGKSDFIAQVKVEPRANVVVQVPALMASGGVAETPASAVAAPDTVTPPHGAWMRPAAIVLGALGVASAAAGTYFGLRASPVYHRSDGHCTADDHCTQYGFDSRSSGEALALDSTITFAAAAGALGGSVLLWVLAPGGTPSAGMRVSPRVGTTSWSLSVEEAW